MVRPIVLMAEMEPPDGLSARKLVLETGKFNVITAYSVEEMLDTLKTFPRVNATVLHASICKEMSCNDAIEELKKHNPVMMVIALRTTDAQRYKGADHHISSHEPQELLNLLRSHFGDPRESAEKQVSRRRA